MGVEGGFFQEYYELGNPRIADLLKSYYYPEGSYYIIFITSVQAIWLTILMLLLFAILVMKKSEPVFLMGLALIGLTLFELLFEARARYLFAYIPIFICMASLSIEELIQRGKLLFRKKKANENHNETLRDFI